jgi:hypothetical protein
VHVPICAELLGNARSHVHVPICLVMHGHTCMPRSQLAWSSIPEVPSLPWPVLLVRCSMLFRGSEAAFVGRLEWVLVKLPPACVHVIKCTMVKVWCRMLLRGSEAAFVGRME